MYRCDTLRFDPLTFVRPNYFQQRGYATHGGSSVGFNSRTVQADAYRGETGSRHGVHIDTSLVHRVVRAGWLDVRHVSPFSVAAAGDGAAVVRASVSTCGM